MFIYVHVTIHTKTHNYVLMLYLSFAYRLQSLSKQSLADSQFVAGIHPEADPEQSAGIFAVLTGEKSLPERWAVRYNYTIYITIYSKVFPEQKFCQARVTLHFRNIQWNDFHQCSRGHHVLYVIITTGQNITG